MFYIDVSESLFDIVDLSVIIIIIKQGLSSARSHSVTGGTHDCIGQFQA